MSCGEDIVQRVCNILINIVDADTVDVVGNAMAFILRDYDISTKETEVGFVESPMEELLKVYAGTLLTEGKSKRTVRVYIYTLKKFADDMGLNLLNATTMDIRSWFATLQMKDVSMRTCENYRFYLSSFYKWLSREEIISKNPMDKIKPIKYKEQEKKAFTDVEIDRLRFACYDLRCRAILELFVCSGIRVGEMSQIKISDVNFDNKYVLIRESKSGRERKVYITNLCISHIKEYLESRTDDVDILFITKYNTSMTTGSFRKVISKIADKAGVKDAHPHKFRVTFATNMYKKGMDVHTIQLLLGHRNIDVTMGYIASAESTTEYMYRRYA